MDSVPKFQQRVDWRTCWLLLTMYVLLLGNFAVYQMGSLPLLAHVLVATVAIHLAFTIWHEAVHRNVSRVAWINDTIGVLGALPYMAPYFIEKFFHLQHHSLLNRPDDPNFIYIDGPFWTLPFRYPRVLQYARQRMRDDGRSPREKTIDRVPMVVALVVYGVAWRAGILLDLVMVWFVPLVLAKLIMDWYVNYLPHAGLPVDRFRGTRIVDVAWLTPLVLGHNYHAVHHLWPSLPWHRYASVFREKLDWMKERGVPIETRLVGVRLRAHDVVGPASRP